MLIIKVQPLQLKLKVKVDKVLDELTGAVTLGTATIMESEMDISLMRLHITRSAINQTSGSGEALHKHNNNKKRQKTGHWLDEGNNNN
ncbi:hypothetical protein ACLKA7_008677 [Drosophila subpalustris]